MTIAPAQIDEPVRMRRAEADATAADVSLTLKPIGELRLSPAGRREPPAELVQLQGKRPGGMPRWLGRILNRGFGGRFPGDWNWIDHWGSAGENFITEPYGLSSEDVRQLLEFCDQYALDFSIRAESQHYPTRTLSLQLWPRRSPHGHATVQPRMTTAKRLKEIEQ